MNAIDLIKIPFSTRGAYTVFSIMKAEEKSQLFIRDIHGGDLDPGCLFTFKFESSEKGDSSNGVRFVDLSEIHFEVTPSLLTATYDDLPFMEVAFEDEEVFRIRTLSSVINVKLEAVAHKYNTIAQIGSAHWEFTSYFKEIKMGIHKRDGDGQIHADWSAIGNKDIEIQLGNESEWRFATYLVSEGVHPFVQDSFEKCERRVNRKFKGWSKRFIISQDIPENVSPALFEMRVHEASHILWQNFVSKSGQLKVPALYMTKNWMTNIWSWDNLFSAMGLMTASPKSAYEQLILFETLQSPEGAFPDYANDRYASYSCNKPPLLGWCYDWLIQNEKSSIKTFVKPSQLNRIYKMTEKQTDYWLRHRISDLGLPYYTHGNDSGWDNGTFFSEGVPVITPDLTTFLLLQIQFLIDYAPDQSRAVKWKETYDTLMTSFIENLWDGEAFIAIKWPEKRIIRMDGTLQRLLPLLLSKNLKEDIIVKLKRDLSEF
ncbi:MAG TPA: hypothetical protein VLS94_09620, partial [Fusibacter sp.]|nr:hypothetical protein [Fusibacter sp.]